ncbi:PHD finger-like domain-containing protein 5A [Microtus ochrogaster]|uniref:PHD finger-like domain-containing protein 5A n=1 Tax=Microtus ochrogaster TaxID=79684 RepID=A0A8J6G6V1_MICOH|nr:PHD finger-like domain-containing protein 5A [Microtus ochrogaster]
MAKHHPDLIFCRKQAGVGDGKCVICDSYVRPCTLVRICDECNYGSYQGRCVICGGPGVSDAYYCKECTIQEKDVLVVCAQCRSSREARRTGLARRSRPGPASIHRVTGAILGPAIPAPSPASSTSRNSGKNHMNSVLVPLNDVKGHRGPQPRGAGEAGRETSVPRPAEHPFAETRVSERAGGTHTGPLPCRLSLERPVGLSLISLFDSRVPSSECGPLLG